MIYTADEVFTCSEWNPWSRIGTGVTVPDHYVSDVSIENPLFCMYSAAAILVPTQLQVSVTHSCYRRLTVELQI